MEGRDRGSEHGSGLWPHKHPQTIKHRSLELTCPHSDMHARGDPWGKFFKHSGFRSLGLLLVRSKLHRMAPSSGRDAFGVVNVRTPDPKGPRTNNHGIPTPTSKAKPPSRVNCRAFAPCHTPMYHRQTGSSEFARSLIKMITAGVAAILDTLALAWG